MIRTGRGRNLFRGTSHSGTSRPAALPLAVALLAVLFLLLGLGSRPPAPRLATAPLDVFSAERAVLLLERVLGSGEPHAVGTPANYLVRDRIMTELERVGYQPQLQSTFACAPGSCAPVQNIAARLDGTEAGPAIVLNAHYDSRAASPGAADNGAGVAALLEIARILRLEAPFRNPVILLFTDGEEVGLLGAEAFVREHPWADDVALVLNLEARGTAGPSIMFQTSAGNAWLVRSFARAVRRPVASSLTDAVYRVLPNDTDATVFMREGAAVLNFAFIRNVAQYHTALDDVAHLSPRSVQHHGDNALSLARALASRPVRSSLNDVAYTDLFGSVMIVFPAGWTLPLAVAITLALLAACVVLIVRRAMGVAPFAWALGGVIAAIAAAVLLAASAAWVIEQVAGRSHARPAAAFVAMWSAALTGVAAAALAVRRRTDARCLLLAAWLVMGMVTVLLALALGAGAVVLLLPLAAAVPIIALHLFAPARWRPAVDTAAVPGALAAGVTLLQLARLLQWTFELQLPLLIAVTVLLAALPLLPLFAVAAGSRVPALAAAAAAVTLVGAVVVAAGQPPYSAQRPQPLNLLHVEDADAAGARWVMAGAATPHDVPAVWRRDGGFVAGPPLPWGAPGAAVLSGDAPHFMLPPPRLEALDAAPAPIPGDTAGAADQRTVTARLLSPRAATRVVLLLPTDSTLAVTIEGHVVHPVRSARPGYGRVTVHGMPPRGVQLEIRFTGTARRRLLLYDAMALDDPAAGPALRQAAAARIRARPATAAATGDGDQSIVHVWIEL
jgi:hypothetical protein